MSSTNRKKSTRNAFDYYPTPAWCVTRFLEKAGIPFTKLPFWLEPAAGDGAIIRAVGNFASYKKNGITHVLQYKPNWVAVEIQDSLAKSLEKEIDKSHILCTDFLTITPEEIGVAPQVIITNPPFNLALDFIKKSMELKAEYICMLLRLNFIGSAERSDFMREHMPDIYVLPNRPSFNNKGTDSIEYAWFVWRQENDYGNPSFASDDKCVTCDHSSKNYKPKVVILDNTSKEERSRKQTK